MLESSSKMLQDRPDRDLSIDEMLMGDEVIDNQNQLNHPEGHCSVIQCLDGAPANKDLCIH